MGYLENRSVPGPDDWTGVPSCLHDEEKGVKGLLVETTSTNQSKNALTLEGGELNLLLLSSCLDNFKEAAL